MNRAIGIGLAVLAVCGACLAGGWYVQNLRGAVDALQRETAILKQSIADAGKAVDDMRTEQRNVDTVLKAWAEDRATQAAIRRDIDRAVKEAIQNDPIYATWRKQVLPDRLHGGPVPDGGMCPENGNGDGAASGARQSARGVDGADARTGMDGQPERRP